MTDETHVDGNALGGMLMEVFGREMTDARGALRDLRNGACRSARCSSTERRATSCAARPAATSWSWRSDDP